MDRTYSNKIGGIGAGVAHLVLSANPPYDFEVKAHTTMVAYWPLYDNISAGATSQQDLGSGGRNAAINGSPTDATGNFFGEGAINFSSSGMFLSSTGSAIQLGTGSVEFWCNIPSNPATSTNKALLFGLVESSSKWDKVFYLNSSGSLIFANQVPAGTTSTLGTSPNFPLGRWNHVLAMCDGTFMKLYVNGVLADSQIVFTSRVDFSGANVFIAGTGGTFGFIDCPGVYNNIAIYTGSPAMTLTDASNHYNAGLATWAAGRVTQVSLDVLRDAVSRKARVTQVTTDVLRDAASRKARVTQLAVEVLRSSAVGIGVSAPNGVIVTGVASSVRAMPRSAADTATITGIAASVVGRATAGSGGTIITGVASAVRDFHVSASDTFVISPVAAESRSIVASASDEAVFGDSAVETAGSPHVPTDYYCDSSTSFTLTPGAIEMANFPESSTAGVVITGVADAFVGHSYTAAAASGIVISGVSIDGYLGRSIDSLRVVGVAAAAVTHTFNRGVTDTFWMHANTAKGRINPIRVSAASGIRVLNNVNEADDTTFAVSAGDHLHITDASRLTDIPIADAESFAVTGAASTAISRAWRKSGTSAVRARDLVVQDTDRVYAVEADDSVQFTDTPDADDDRLLDVHPTSIVRVHGRADVIAAKNVPVSASSSVGIHGRSVSAIYRHLSGMASSSITVQGGASERGEFGRMASSNARITGTSGRGRAVSVAAITGLGLISGGLPKGRFYANDAEGIFSLHADAYSGIGSRNGRDQITITSSADGRTSLGDGPATVLLSGTSGDYPMSYAETPSGLILIADGIDPMIRWDGLAAVAGTAGIIPPRSPISLGGMNIGIITGRRVAYCRYIDAFGNRSNLSPCSNEVDFGRDALIDDLTINPTTSRVTIRSEAHGLGTNDAIVVGGCDGLGVNGIRVVTVLTPDTFTLNDIGASGQYQGGGYWVWGIETIVYGSVPIPSDPKIVRRQILRNLSGDASTLYVDVDTTDLTSSTIASVSDDEALASHEAVSMFFDDDLPAANRYGVPPSHKSVVASHLGRIFATAEVTYREGSCSVVYGSREIRGVATDWRQTFVSRLIYIAGATQAYVIASVDEVAQSITLTAPYADSTNLFCTYAIRSAPGERKLVYYSEPSLPESWPAWNAIAVPEDSDEIVGMLVKGSFLYILERRHIYRFTFQKDPASDGFLFLSTSRGCINNRCHVQVEDATYMLDDTGIHAFDGGQASTPMSAPIQNLFQLDGAGGFQVDWSADQTLWHAAHDPVRDTIRWFVHFVGDTGLTHALCYDYRLTRWWIEEYPSSITASTVGTIGYRRSLVGTTSRRILCLSEGSLDGIEPQDGLRGTSTGGDTVTLTDAAGLFPDGLGGTPVSITDGTLKGQTRVIASNTATDLTLVQPWDNGGAPDSTTEYQIGGVPWSWRSGWFRHAEDEADNPRDIEVVFQPQAEPATIDLALYYDHSESPEVWAYDRSDDGVMTRNGSPYVSMDLATPSGFTMHRVTGHRERYAHGPRFVQIGLSGVQASSVVRIFQVGVSGSSSEKS